MEITSVVSQDFLPFEPTVSVSTMLSELQNLEKRAGLIFHNKKYLGIVEKRKILKKHMNGSNMNVQKVLSQVPIVNSHTSVEEAAFMFAQSNTNYLPVETNKEINGVISSINLLSLTKNLETLSNLKVQDIKYIKPAQVNKESPLSLVIELMQHHNLDLIPIFDEGKLHGSVSHKELLRKLLNWSPKRDTSTSFNAQAQESHLDIHSIGAQKAGLIVNEDYPSIQESEPIHNAINKMVEHQTNELLILKEDKWKGILTAREILRHVGDATKQIAFTTQFIGLNKITITEHQRQMLYSITDREGAKLQRKIKDQFQITLHVKDARKDGTQQLFQVNLRLQTQGKMITSEKEDWDLETAVHKCFNHVQASFKF